MMADFRDQLRVLRKQLKNPNTKVVFNSPITESGKTVQYFENDDTMLAWISKYVPPIKWDFKVFHRPAGKWAWKEVLNHHHEKETIS
jgi:hypothetical protein